MQTRKTRELRRQDFYRADGSFDQAAYRKEYKRVLSRRRHDQKAAQLIAASTQWRTEHPDSSRGYQASYRARLRAQVLDKYGGRCGRCGIDDPRVLQIDHIDGAPEPRGHKLRGGEGLYRALLTGVKRWEDHQLLCANCNWIKAHERNEFRAHREITSRKTDGA